MEIEREFKAKILNAQEPYFKDAFSTLLKMEQG